MKKVDERIIQLMQLHLTGEISDKDKRELEAWCEAREGNRRFFERICREDLFAREHGLYVRVDDRRAWIRFKRSVGLPVGRSRVLRVVWRCAAVLVLPLVVAAVWLYRSAQEEPVTMAERTERIVPGSPRAVLVLEDGKKVALVPGAGREIQVSKEVKAQSKGDQLTYQAGEEMLKKQDVHYNELSIPRGGEFKLELSDGTLVHLNADTRLKYPVVFAGQERRVVLDGEAYFEVTKDVAHPFIVEVDGVEVKVYGTSFNVNTLLEGRVQTVLVAGSVGVRSLASGEEVRVKPGELAEYDRGERDFTVREVDTSFYTDWRNGILRFSNEPLDDMLETLARWYNVNFFYQNQEVKNLHFTGYMERYKDIEVILKSVTMSTGVHFSIQGRTIVVSK